jgi:hypothetical protein
LKKNEIKNSKKLESISRFLVKIEFKSLNNESYKISQIIKKRKSLGFIEKPLSFIENHSVFLKIAPLFTGFCVFFIAIFLENRLVLFETYTFANILRISNLNQTNDVDLKNFLH